MTKVRFWYFLEFEGFKQLSKSLTDIQFCFHLNLFLNLWFRPKHNLGLKPPNRSNSSLNFQKDFNLKIIIKLIFYLRIEIQRNLYHINNLFARLFLSKFKFWSFLEELEPERDISRKILKWIDFEVEIFDLSNSTASRKDFPDKDSLSIPIIRSFLKFRSYFIANFAKKKLKSKYFFWLTLSLVTDQFLHHKQEEPLISQKAGRHQFQAPDRFLQLGLLYKFLNDEK